MTNEVSGSSFHSATGTSSDSSVGRGVAVVESVSRMLSGGEHGAEAATTCSLGAAVLLLVLTSLGSVEVELECLSPTR